MDSYTFIMFCYFTSILHCTHYENFAIQYMEIFFSCYTFIMFCYFTSILHCTHYENFAIQYMEIFFSCYTFIMFCYFTSILHCTHYENFAIQYMEIFFCCKIEKFSRKKLILLIFFSQNIDCGYTLEPHHQAVLSSIHNLCFGAKTRKIGVPLHTPVLLCKMGYKGYTLHGDVILML